MLKQTSENSNMRFWPTSSFKVPIDHNRITKHKFFYYKFRFP